MKPWTKFSPMFTLTQHLHLLQAAVEKADALARADERAKIARSLMGMQLTQTPAGFPGSEDPAVLAQRMADQFRADDERIAAEGKALAAKMLAANDGDVVPIPPEASGELPPMRERSDDDDIAAMLYRMG